jgi:hypothetical protein
MELNLRYDQLKRNTNNQSRTMEHAYYMGGRFKGKCNCCGRIGHKYSECRDRIQGKPKVKSMGKNYGSVNYMSSHDNSNRQQDLKTTYSDPPTIKRKNITCNYCNKMGGGEHECNKKKHQR